LTWRGTDPQQRPQGRDTVKISKWSSLAAVAALAAIMSMGFSAKPDMAQANSQQWQGGNGGPSQGQSWNSQQSDSRGRGNYDNQGGRGGNGGCNNGGYSNTRRHRHNSQSWNQGTQRQNRGGQGQNPRWKNGGRGKDGRGDQGWNGGNNGQDGRNDQGWNGGGQGQGNGGRH
jgi:hypothetical protein